MLLSVRPVQFKFFKQQFFSMIFFDYTEEPSTIVVKSESLKQAFYPNDIIDLSDMEFCRFRPSSECKLKVVMVWNRDNLVTSRYTAKIY